MQLTVRHASGDPTPRIVGVLLPAPVGQAPAPAPARGSCGWSCSTSARSAGLLVYSFWSLEEFTGLIARDFTLETYGQLLEPAHRDIIFRTLSMAAAVSVACAVLAFPLAYYMARYATSRMKTVLYLAVLMPLWSSYLVRALAWRQILAHEGV